jgi:hypothetical protein
MQVIENFLPPSLFNVIKEALLSDEFPWYFNETVAEPTNVNNNFQFTHTFYKEGKPKSNFFPAVNPIIYILEEKLKVKILGIRRIKSNLMVPIQNHIEGSEAHTDESNTAINYKTLLFYVNDSDGDTCIFDKDKNVIKRITPKQNSALWFDSNTLHSSTPPTNSKRRIVINFILVAEDAE